MTQKRSLNGKEICHNILLNIAFEVTFTIVPTIIAFNTLATLIHYKEEVRTINDKNSIYPISDDIMKRLKIRKEKLDDAALKYNVPKNQPLFAWLAVYLCLRYYVLSQRLVDEISNSKAWRQIKEATNTFFVPPRPPQLLDNDDEQQTIKIN
tara:strand:+ start:1191 stop:1646 length:456 start_codon:yes stop_codon:yes gene_type:complete